MLSEEGLLNALWTKDTKSLLCRIIGASSETVGAAIDRVITNKGILFRSLFSMGSYRGVGLQADYSIPDEHLSNNSASDAIPEGLQDNTLEEAMDEVDDPQEYTRPRKLLRPVIVTDGVFLNLVVFDTLHRRPRRKRSDTDDAINDEQESEDQDMLDILNGINEDLEVENPFLPVPEADEGPTTIIETHEPCVSTSSSAQPQARGAINWAQRSRDLENVGTVLAKPEDCQEYKNAARIGIDPGVKYPITATKVDPLNPEKRHTVRISSAFLNRPYHIFRRELEERKRHAGISRLESQIPSLSRSTIPEYFTYLFGTSLESVSGLGSTMSTSLPYQVSPSSSSRGTSTVFNRIDSFYRDCWFRRARWNMKRGQTGCLDIAIKRLLRMAGGTEGAKKKPEIKAIFGVGMAQFSGPNSKHTKLLKRFIMKASPLVHFVRI